MKRQPFVSAAAAAFAPHTHRTDSNAHSLFQANGDLISSHAAHTRRPVAAPPAHHRPHHGPSNTIIALNAVPPSKTKLLENHALRRLPGAGALGGFAAGLNRPPVGAIVGLATAILVGFVLGRITGGTKRLSNADASASDKGGGGGEEAFAVPKQDFNDPSVFQEQDSDVGVTPRWLNYAFARMWSLFRKNTKRLIADVIQPVLDETEKPDFVTAVKLKSFTPGRQSPYLRSLRRLPSRALAEVQYSVNALFSSTSTFEFDVAVQFGKKTQFTIPVTMRNLDVDAIGWCSFMLAPYEPFVTGVQYALLEKPDISFDMTIGGLVPITALPVLRQFFFRVITTEIPKEFLFPKTVALDFTPEMIADAKGNLKKGLVIQDLAALDEEQLKERFPEQWALFDAMDLDNGGSLSPVEIFSGLKDWGYTAEDASEGFEQLDVNKDDSVSFAEFCQMWPSLESSFVPNRYRGVLAVFVRSASGLTTPLIGKPDPVVRLKLSGREAVSKRDSQTSADGKAGEPLWNEAFELNCLDPTKEELEIVITDASKLAWRGLGRSNEVGRCTVPLASFVKRPNQQLRVNLEPRGTLLINLSYADFVDNQGTRLKQAAPRAREDVEAVRS